jgi:hypothetical protein
MRFGSKDIFVKDVVLPSGDILVGWDEDGDPVTVTDGGSDASFHIVAETVNGIVLSGPFAGPFVVEIVRYTGPHMRTKYFWNGHSILRKELYLCGDSLPEKKVNLILDALKQGVQYDNSTVPMVVTDLLSNKQLTSDDVLGEPTMRFFK